MAYRKSPLPTRLNGPSQHEGPGERGLLLPPRGQRDEATRAATTEAAAALHGALAGGHTQLHRARGLAEAGVHPGLRLVVCRGHPLRNDHWSAAVLCGQHSQYSGEGK